VQQIVVVSIIGTDKFTTGYNAAKLAQIRTGTRISRGARFGDRRPTRRKPRRDGETARRPAR
jgi:hypothetical protein